MSDGNVTRRRFLQMLELLGAGAAAGLAGVTTLNRLASAGAESPAPAASGVHDGTSHQWVFVMDLRRCDGCEQCVDACQKQHYLPKEQTWIKVYKMHGASGEEFFMPRVCMQCENAPCVRVCPVGASYKTADGITLVDQDRCIGCRMCMAACPYEARYFNWSEPPAVPAFVSPASPEWPVPQQKGTVGKCVMCVHSLREGKLPACVLSCSMEALYIGDLNSDLATNGREVVKLSEFMKANDVVRYKEELNTRPRVYYVLGHGQNLEY